MHRGQRWWLCLLVALHGCGNEASTPEADAVGDAAASGVTYHGVIRPILEASCTPCHRSGGGAPFALVHDGEDWADGAPWWALSVVDAVETQRMPPWTPAQGCREMVDERRLTAYERSMFTAWDAAGYPEGDPVDYGPPPASDAPDLGEPDLVVDAGFTYVPSTTSPDDYRCFPLGITFAKDTFVTATQILPDQKDLVHHVILYTAPPEAVPFVDQQERLHGASDPGYPCFGGPGFNEAQVLGGWVPGALPFVSPGGSARYVRGGSRVVMQIHYNTAGLGLDEPAPGDRTQAALWVLPDGELPGAILSVVPHAHVDIWIPSGDAHSIQSHDQAIASHGTVVGVVPHMHVLGKQIRAELIREGAPPECLVDIPAWDFNWQQFYLFTEENYLDVTAGDTHRLTCIYDNSEENQPEVGGVQGQPKDVEWGDKTSDEMCLNYLIVMQSYEDALSMCGGYKACQLACEPGDLLCFYMCAFGAGEQCVGCVADAFTNCGMVVCAEETQVALECYGTCTGSTLACLQGKCNAAFSAMYSCVEPKLEVGACNEQLTGCEVAY